jgi:glycosyltransferase involved in cell wall biosynthesis
MTQSVSVIIPAYNEEQSIAKVVEGVYRVLGDAGIEAEVIVVDDGSTDATGSKAESAGATVFRHISNRGYGASLKTGIVAARFELIAITDADETYPVDRLADFVAEMDRADMVIGARTGKYVHIPLVRRPAKWFLAVLANYVTKSEIQDLNSGMRVFRRTEALQYFNILPDQFSFTSTITIAMHCDRYAISYIPIDYFRRNGRSKIVAWDAATFTSIIVRTAMLFKPLRVFLPVVMIMLAYGIVKGVFDYIANGFFSHTAVFAGLGALQFLLMGLIADALARHLNHVGGEAYAKIARQMKYDHEVATRMNRFGNKPPYAVHAAGDLVETPRRTGRAI